MSNVKGILERAGLDRLIAFMLDESEPVNGKIEIDENAVEDSCGEFIIELARLFPVIDKDDDELIDAVIKFAAVNEERYLKIGIIAGVGMRRELGEG